MRLSVLPTNPLALSPGSRARRLAVPAPHFSLLPILLLSATFSISLPFAAAQSQPQPTPCFRWSGQMALANAKGNSSGNTSTASTLWYYGGEARTTAGQDNNTWTNALVSISLEDDWETGSPPLTLVEADTGNYSFPPAVTLGALWASADGNTLYEYGGSFSDSPSVAPPAAHVYAYDIQGGDWSIVQTTGDTFGNVAEGQPAIAEVNGEMVGYYSYGHQDDHTTQGWSNQIDRIYLNSLFEFNLGTKQVTNVTSFSTAAKTSNSSTVLTNPVSRADGSLTYVPGLGTNSQGLLIAIGGATETQYVDASTLDVFDIGAGGWTRQAVGGASIGSRVNHCAVRASAKVAGVQVDHIFVYGGQQLNQLDRDSAVYVLTIAENDYTWTFVGDDLPGQPAGRAGHQCALKGNQLIVVGGLTTDDVICEQPGVFVYNVSGSTWETSYAANTIFSTPDIVANITGGIGTGTSSSGAGSATGGDGSTDPDTSSGTDSSSGGNGSSSDSPNSSSGKRKSNIGAIVGGVVGGIVGLALIALLFFLLARRRKHKRDDERNAEKARLAGRSDSGSSGGTAGGRFGAFSFPSEKHRQQPSNGSEFPPGAMEAFEGRRQSGVLGPADDDVEDQMLGRDTYIASGLAPRRELRVVNGDE